MASGSITSNVVLPVNRPEVNEGWGIYVEWSQIADTLKIQLKVYMQFRASWADLRLARARPMVVKIGDTTSNFTFNSELDNNYGPYANASPSSPVNVLIGTKEISVGTDMSTTIEATLDMSAHGGWTLRGHNVTGFRASGSIKLDSLMEIPNDPTDGSLTISDTSLSFSWKHSTSNLRPVKDFEVERSINGGAYSSVTTTANKSVTGTGSRGSSYKYRVRARNDVGNSGWAYSETKTVAYLPPNTPSLSSSLSGTSVSLSWTVTEPDSRPISGFTIERRVNNGSWSSLASPSSASRSYTNSGLTRGSTYDYRIKASGSGGDSSWSTVTSKRVPYLAPNRPTDVSVTRSSHTRFALTWKQNVTSDRPVDSFDIYRKVNGGSFAKIGSVSGTKESYNDDTVEIGKSYQYYVKAINVDGNTNSDNSNELTNPAGLPVYNGTNYTIHPVYVYNGTNWVHRSVYQYDGSSWHWRG